MDSVLSIFVGDARYALVKAILRGAESLLGKIQWFMLGLWEAEKPPAKSYELFWAQNTFSLKTVGPLEPFCSLLNCFYAVSNVNLCFCSHEILSAPFSLLAQSTDGLERLEIKYRNHLRHRKNQYEEGTEAFILTSIRHPFSLVDYSRDSIYMRINPRRITMFNIYIHI